jgi:lipoyl synthase
MCEKQQVQQAITLPQWLRRPPGSVSETRELKQLLRASGLNTVCEEARCPNIAECFGRRTLTFLILGDRCSRRCGFCSIERGSNLGRFKGQEEEARQVADAVRALGLSYVVITSVTRDDLPDGGASAYALSVQALRAGMPEVRIELLVPDFSGSEKALRVVLESGPDVLGHNLETVPRLYHELRPQAVYERSLRLLGRAKELAPAVLTKTGIMLGLGETRDEVIALMKEAREQGVGVFTAGQYLQPNKQSYPVQEYLPLDAFEFYRIKAKALGFAGLRIGPLVRSSYHAAETLACVDR